MDQKIKKIVAFKCDENFFGIDISHIREIIPLPEINKTPHAPLHILGAANIRGEIISIADGTNILTGKEGTPHNDSKVIILNLKSKNAGLCVDKVLKIENISPQEIHTPPSEIKKNNPSVIGIVDRDYGMLLVVDPEKLF